VGRFCDQIDECLLLKCIHGKCVNGKGCVCEFGYNGYNCEKVIELSTKKSTTSTTSLSSLSPDTIKLGFYQKLFNTTTRSAFTSLLMSTTLAKNNYNSSIAIKTSQTSTPTTKTMSSTSTTTLSTSTSSTMSTTTFLMSTTLYPSLAIYPTTHKNNHENYLFTTQPITSCKNGGLLIDNICICLNQFTGPRCNFLLNLIFLLIPSEIKCIDIFLRYTLQVLLTHFKFLKTLNLIIYI
jgi:hypothetical protein